MVAACLERLASLGRQGPRALAVLVLIGVALPPLGRLTRPWLAKAVFLLLTLSFLRVDTARLRAHLGRPGVIAAATLWSAFGVPLIFYGIAEMAMLRDREPGLFLGLMLQGLASPMMAAPSLAALAGLDATLVLITLVTGTALVPVVAPVLAQLLVGDALAVPPLALGARLGSMLAGSLVLASVLRRLVARRRWSGAATR